MKLKLTKLGGLMFVITLLLFNGCKIVTVEQANTASTGEKITVHLECQIIYDDVNPHYGLLGLLIPNDWATDSVYYEGDVGTGSLSFLHPDSADAEPGVQDYWADSLEVYFPSGDDMQWVVYQSDKAYTVLANNYIDVYIDFTVGNKAGNYNISYFISNAANEIKLGKDYYDISQDNPITVAGPELVNVMLIVNTSTNLDTLGTNGFVEVRGALNEWKTGAVLPGGKVIDWNTSSDLDMVNVGGDYWQVTFQMMSDDTLRYKFWTGHNSATGTYPNDGWEGACDNIFCDTRVLITSTSDTLVPVQYYNPDLGLGPQPQYKKPFESKPDTVAIYFRVNMGGEMEAERFDPKTNGPIGLRGDPNNSAGVFDWGVTNPLLKWEEKSVYNGSFWSGVAYFDKDSVTARTTQKFKFYAENTPDFSWEDGSDHVFKYPVGLKDTTIHWTWFSGKKITGLPPVEPVESIITWRVSTEALEALGLFDRGKGDDIIIRGPRGWDYEDAVILNFNPLLQEWTSANESFTLPPGTAITYKYFIDWDPSRLDTNSPNYIPGLTNTDGSTRGWEEPAITGGGDRIHVFLNAAEQNAVGDFGFDRQFFNSVPANGVFDHDITVTWNVNMTNATSADSNAANASNLFRPGIDTAYVRWDGEMTAITQGHDMWSENFLALSDPDGDMIYSGSYTIKVSTQFPHNWYQIGYKVAYSTSEPGLYIVTPGGGGVKLGRRYMQYIHPDQVLAGSPWPITVWPTSFNLPVVSWRDGDLFVEYPPPDLTKPTAVSGKEIGVPLDFALEQNYPNPFNPSTTINYTMAKGARISIKVYNVSGQLVATLIDAYQPQGHHSVKWLGKDASGKDVTSGLYLVKMIAGDFNQVSKMMLLR